MRSKIAVIGEQAVVGALRAGDRFAVVPVAPEAWSDLAGADVVVVTDGTDVPEAARAALRRASQAMLVVATGDLERDGVRALEAGLAPRPRVLGVRRDDLVAAVEAIVFGRLTQLEAAVLCRGELGIEDRVATVPVTLGAAGIEQIGPY
jgi:hypothetical protein